MVDFNKLRARKGTNFSSLQAKLEKTDTGGGFKKDDRIWKPTANKDAKSSNIIRFLPIPYVDEVKAAEGALNEDDLTPMARILSHFIQGQNGYYVEKSLQTFGEKCPVADFTIPQWKTQKETNDQALKNRLMKMFPRTQYYANVLVIKDGTNPENNGKVMLYEFGESIRKLIETSNNPEFDTDTPVDPFDVFEGADLLLNLTYEKKKFNDRESLVPDFKAVRFAKPSALADGDEEEIERIWKEQHSIAEFYDRKHFKTYEELEAKLQKVMGASAAQTKKAATSAEEMVKEMTGESSVVEAEEPKSKSEPKIETTSDDFDEDLLAFEKLLNGD